MSENNITQNGQIRPGSIAEVVEQDLKPLEKEPLNFEYARDFAVDESYIATLPDLQNGAAIHGAPIRLEKVGIHNFRLPIKYRRRDKSELIELETSVTGTVSLEASKKGINMSRIMRAFYEHKDTDFTIDTLIKILRDYKRNLDSFEAQILLKLSYPILQDSLRSGLEGFQYYDVIMEMGIDKGDKVQKTLHFDFVYSSACPCSFELAEHARATRNQATVSHSQRSTARISVKFDGMMWIEDLHDLCLRALQTETQVMVKREDEQAFAELNASYLKFVEDAARLMYESLAREPRISDFKIVCSHQESLHSHDAVAVVAKGIEGGFNTDVTYNEFRSLVK
ncbi:GTP cyclohydrolase I [Abditibacterium utsteinense]|uniref:GTP cyclohydrolase I n=1 Tax=Abditibacterium utsteinense TaxID=1960156 RepID=A0A2S8SX73_9BACT|nr:GTP cyclohydrolase FolE2 [Abditibacterium utsteinense]PQV65397.1 GTP cyclohydrolase I [Abditibacterium utsteinense]